MANGKQLQAAAALGFMLAGKATFTLRSLKTGARYTYRVTKHDTNPIWFVKLMTGPDNEESYSYIGVIQNKNFRTTAKSKLPVSSAPCQAIWWVLKQLVDDTQAIGQVEIWHAGKCGRCGRTLTVPESIDSGFGPECIQMVGGMAA
jgi:hypothetical protein